MGKDDNKIVWLASYPKSGNTWFRVFLTNLLRKNTQPAHINELQETSIASARNLFDEFTGLPSEDLTHEEMDALRPEVYQWIADEAEELVYKKVHDAYTYLPDGRPLFPPEASHAVIYFIRDPLDVAVSFAHHSAKQPGEMIKALNNPNFSFCGKRHRFYNQLRQKLGTWSQHVKSWVDQCNIPVHVMRYEDMQNDTFQTFQSAVRFLNLDKTDDTIQKAIELSDLSVLQQQEQEQGFREKMIKAESFFRKGSIGEGKQLFSEQQKKEIVDNHFDVLRRFGYLRSVDR